MASKTETKKVATKATEKKSTKCCAKKCATATEFSKINIGFKAGDVYQALASADSALTLKEIAKKAQISEEETLLGLGWLFKEGKVASNDGKLTLA